MDARRFISRHNETGFALISAERTGCSRLENKEATSQLAERLRKEGYNFKKVYGGYVMSSDGKRTQEVSFVVFPYKGRKAVDCETMALFCCIMGDIFGQESVLVKEARFEQPYLWYCGMNKRREFIPGGVVYNDESQEYYTDFRRGTSGKLSSDKRATRFSFV